jgi:hypothetical protein
MEKVAIIENGVVVNIAVYDVVPTGAVLAYGCNIGDQWDGKNFSPAHVAPTVDDLREALTQHLDRTAQARRYDNRITCMVRAGFSGPFRDEALAFATWADTCNLKAYAMLADVEAGKTQMPSTIDEFISQMPKMVWPA